MKILVLPRHSTLGASSRLRLLQYIPWLGKNKHQTKVAPFFSDHLLSNKYASGRYSLWGLFCAYASRVWLLINRRNFDLVWIEKEALPWLPAWLEVALLKNVPYVLDFDDATFHNYDLHPSAIVKKIYGRRIDRVMASASLVVSGNQYLATRARSAGAQNVEIIPTVIDINRYIVKSEVNDADSKTLLRIVWIGSPTTAKYLKILEEPLKALGATHPFVLRVIGAELDMPGVQLETCTWTESSEVDLLRECDVGIMPLIDTPWEQGKCGYKLIQYMACGLPVVASPVGANLNIVQPGRNGYLAKTSDEWLSALQSLLASAQARQAMGSCGRQDVESQYAIQVTAPVYVKALEKVVMVQGVNDARR